MTDDQRLAPKLALLERQVQQINRFPDQNPHPVMRMAHDGTLMYANVASAPLRDRWRVSVGDPIPADIRDRLIAAAGPDGEPIAVACDQRTFSLVAVDVADLGFINVYGTDVSAAKAIDRFPGGNPNPVMRMSLDGELLYANDASSRIVAALGLSIGAHYSPELVEALATAAHDPAAGPSEIDADGRTFLLTPVYIPEFDFINVYGTDITARKAINKFPDQNPNPVLRVAQDGRLAYANPASRMVRKALGAEVGDELPAARLAEIRSAAKNARGGVIELTADGQTYEVLVVSVFEYDFINLYGTDVTAAREVARANAENERLLLNILPASIARRLRAGEVSIADRFDEVTVLFADVASTDWRRSRPSGTRTWSAAA